MDVVQEQLARDAARLAAEQPLRRRANAEPLPGPLARAFGIEELKVMGFTIRPVVASDFILLKQLDSPLYRQVFALAEHARRVKAGEVLQDAPPPETKYDEAECVEMIYQFTRPLAEVRAALRAGRAQFRETALGAITDALPIAQMEVFPRLVASVVENFTAAFGTAVQYGAPDKDENHSVFTTPAAAGATASAGGSIMSRDSVTGIPANSGS